MMHRLKPLFSLCCAAALFTFKVIADKIRISCRVHVHILAFIIIQILGCHFHHRCKSIVVFHVNTASFQKFWYFCPPILLVSLWSTIFPEQVVTTLQNRSLCCLLRETSFLTTKYNFDATHSLRLDKWNKELKLSKQFNIQQEELAFGALLFVVQRTLESSILRNTRSILIFLKNNRTQKHCNCHQLSTTIPIRR